MTQCEYIDMCDCICDCRGQIERCQDPIILEIITLGRNDSNQN